MAGERLRKGTDREWKGSGLTARTVVDGGRLGSAPSCAVLRLGER